MAVEFLHADIAQRLDIRKVLFQQAHGFLAGRAALVVLAAGQFPAHGGIGDDNGNIFREWDGLPFQGAAVEQEQAVLYTAGGSELIHDAAVDAYILVLRFLAKQGALHRWEGPAAKGLPGEHEGHLHRSRRAQA